MAIEFPAATVPQPTAIKELHVTLSFLAAQAIPTQPIPEQHTVQYRVVLVDAEGNTVTHPFEHGNLMPYLTPPQQTQVRAFMDAMLLKAARLIPGS